MNVFVDTNVLLDVLLKRVPYYGAAARLWTLSEVGKVKAFVSVISFNNIYYIIRKLSGKEKAVEALRLLRDVFEVVLVNNQILNQAIDIGMDDFEDAVQFFCALRSRSRYLITRIPKDFPKSGPIVVSADEFIALIQASQ